MDAQKTHLNGQGNSNQNLCYTQLIYPFTVFENPNIKMCNNLTTEIFKFVWDNKPDKIKEIYYIKSMNMVDLN